MTKSNGMALMVSALYNTQKSLYTFMRFIYILYALLTTGGNNIEEMRGLHAPLSGARGLEDHLYVIPSLCWVDASTPVEMEPKDWVVSFEVGEHIDKAFEDIFIDNLVSLSTKGVVLSWAVEGQGGLNHM